MNHRIVSTVVVIIVALFAGAAGLFAWTAYVVAPPTDAPGYAPDDPHPPAELTDPCLDCHTVEDQTIPLTHRNFRVETCSLCHRPAVRVLVPHSITMGNERCPLCHGEPARDLGMPVSHLRFETDDCLLCHPVDTRYADREPQAAGLSLSPASDVPHPEDGIFAVCAECHHVEPRSSLPANHKDFSQETCTECHEPTYQEPSERE